VTRSAYYDQMKALARATRVQHGLTSPRVQKSHLRAIYRAEHIHLDLWPHKMREVRGAYFNDDLGPTVMLVKGLPEDPTVFTMAHELKHHLVDRDLPLACCSNRNANEHIEIGAEIFAAELIFPEQDFISALLSMGIPPGQCKPETLVHLKRETRTTLSYAGLVKRSYFLGLAPASSLDGVRWKKLEEQIYGVPSYRAFLRRNRTRV